MAFSNKHKALCITFLISGTLVMAMFNLHINQLQNRISETFYDILPEKEIDKKEVLELTEQEQIKAETNKAFNQNQESRRMAHAYKKIAPPKDYIRPELTSDVSGFLGKNKLETNSSKIEDHERHSFSEVNDILNKQLEDDSNNVKSSVSFSLVNRMHRFLPTPRYLCETSGKIVVNIVVDTLGKVIDASYNNASNTSNQCLIEHALEYAKKAKFNTDRSKVTQIGTITFHFAGKP